jgi:hypothetical protein
MAQRIALYVPSLHCGGAERVMLTLAGAFAESGFEVDLVVAAAEGPYLSQVPPQVRLVDLAASRVLTSLPGLVRYLRQYRPTALLSAMEHANVVALWGRALARVPMRVVVSIHITVSENAQSGNRCADGSQRPVPDRSIERHRVSSPSRRVWPTTSQT